MLIAHFVGSKGVFGFIGFIVGSDCRPSGNLVRNIQKCLPSLAHRVIHDLFDWQILFVRQRLHSGAGCDARGSYYSNNALP